MTAPQNYGRTPRRADPVSAFQKTKESWQHAPAVTAGGTARSSIGRIAALREPEVCGDVGGLSSLVLVWVLVCLLIGGWVFLTEVQGLGLGLHFAESKGAHTLRAWHCLWRRAQGVHEFAPHSVPIPLPSYTTSLISAQLNSRVGSGRLTTRWTTLHLPAVSQRARERDCSVSRLSP